MRNLRFLLLACLVSACGTVEIPNQRECGIYPDLSGGACFDTLDSETQTLSSPAEVEAYFGENGNPKVCAAASDIAATKGIIEKLCSETDKCDYETQQAIKTFFLRLKRFQSLKVLAGKPGAHGRATPAAYPAIESDAQN